MKLVKSKITIIGAGMVGSAILQSLLSLGDIAEIVILNRNQDKAKGEALDASHSTSFAYSPNILIKSGTYEDCKDSQIIVITAGDSIKPGQKIDRIQLASKNVKIIGRIMTNIKKYTNDTIILMVSNPVDILTYYAQNTFGYPKDKIIGSGTMLDTARLRRILGEKYLVDTKNIHGYVLGEHGATAFTPWSLVNIAGIPIDDFSSKINCSIKLNKKEIVDEVKKSGFEILQLKGYTNFGVSTSIARLIKAILINELSILPVSTTLNGEYGIKDVALSLPCIISNEGIKKILEIPLNNHELKLLNESANFLKTTNNKILCSI